MNFDVLTRDNVHLSRPTIEVCEGVESLSRHGLPSLAGRKICASICNPRVAALVENSISGNTRRAYQSDLAHFEAWGGDLPADPTVVASYLAAHAETLSVATLVRRMATISKAHEARGVTNPCRAEIVRATLRGLKRMRGVAQREAKPLLKEDLKRLKNLGTGGFERSEGRLL